MNLLRCCSFHTPEEACAEPSLWDLFPETLEIGIGAACSIVTWSFTLQSESSFTPESVCVTSTVDIKIVANEDEQQPTENAVDSFLFHPAAELMLCSCLVFGCCVSSFVHRRQEQDRFQLLVYAAFLSAAATIGYSFGASANLILLGYFPWAMCAAMAASLYGHGLHRQQRSRSLQRFGDVEKARLLR
ncbi:hypothetical protein OQA88_3782 [Cercophora sp. LCS_1]